MKCGGKELRKKKKKEIIRRGRMHEDRGTKKKTKEGEKREGR